MKQKAIVAMSGGVDSAVAAYLIKSEGYDARGITLRLSAPEASENSCCKSSDIEDAAAVCKKLGIEFEVLDHSVDFRDCVIRPFAESYLSGRTPNPCVECNRSVKFGALCDIAKSEDAVVVTGHYVIREYSEKYGRHVLKKAEDETKDQSYVLWQLTREQVERTRFPLGSMTKLRVRAIADECGFPNFAKKDSQDICFISGEDYGDFLERFLGTRFPEGNFVDRDGNVLGRHKGIIRYTIGQRKGLGLALPSPLYVCEKRCDTNEVVLCPEDGLYTREMTVGELNFQAIDGIDRELRALVKNRYRHTEQPATISCDNGVMRVVYDTPQRAITPGQSAVVYDSDGVLLLGGKIIK